MGRYPQCTPVFQSESPSPARTPSLTWTTKRNQVLNVEASPLHAEAARNARSLDE
jgi:hypothetical protein